MNSFLKKGKRKKGKEKRKRKKGKEKKKTPTKKLHPVLAVRYFRKKTYPCKYKSNPTEYQKQHETSIKNQRQIPINKTKTKKPKRRK